MTTAAEVKYAGFWIRLGATMIDVFIFSVILMFLLVSYYGTDQVIEYFVEIMKSAMQGGQTLTVRKMGGFHIFVEYVMPLILVVIFWKYKSATPGKMMFGLKIVDSETLSEDLTTKQLIGRYFAYLVPMLPLGLGFLFIAFDAKKQGWHDKISKTLVIKQ
jgi:uncharacterized RDD family membrane protein YckC